MEADEIAERASAGLAATREAGALAKDYYGRRHALQIESKGLQDVVSIADQACEDLIVSTLGSRFPDDSFLGEERGLSKKGEPLWIVDPIDGTANFVRGIGHWCVSVGLVVGTRALLGFVYDPLADEMFSAVAGDGARLNGEPIRVSGETELTRARIGLGFSFRRPVPGHARDITALLTAGAEYSRLGSGALGVAYVAAGRFDAYWERHVNAWDVIAGLAIGREAGAATSDFMTGDWLREGNEVLAATPALYEPLRALLGR